MNYDTWKTTPPDTDACSDDATTCECPECRKWRDNLEPGDPDGDALRGGESAAWHREHQFTVLRTLK